MERQKLLEGEKIEKIIKGHQIYFYKLSFQFLLVLLCAWLLYYFFQENDYILLINIILFQIFFSYLYKKLMSYEFHKLIITNQRIIGFFQVSFFEYEFFETNLSKISEIRGKTVGFFPNYFGYGNLEITMKGQDKIFCLSQAKDIIKNAQMIQGVLLADKQEKKE